HNKDKAFASNDGVVVASAAVLVRPLRDFARSDRVIVWSPTVGLSIYPAGEPTPVATVAAIDQEPRGAAWIERKLLVVWTATRLTLLSDGGEVQWAADLQALPGGAAGNGAALAVAS